MDGAEGYATVRIGGSPVGNSMNVSRLNPCVYVGATGDLAYAFIVSLDGITEPRMPWVA